MKTRKNRIQTSEESRQKIIGEKLTSLLKAFKTDNLDQKIINNEAEVVRAELYSKRLQRNS